jgi:hypothetical protein
MEPFTLMRYLWAMFQHSQQKGLARGNIDMAWAAVDRMHKLAGQQSPTEDVGVQELRRSIGRELGIKGRQARPLEERVIEKIFLWISTLHESEQPQHKLMLLGISVLKEGIMRWDDLVRVEFGDVVVTVQYARLFVTEGKTDKVRKGFWHMVPRRDQPWSAYQMLLTVPELIAAEFGKLLPEQKGAWLRLQPGAASWESGRGSVALNRVRLLCPMKKVHGALLPAGVHVSKTYHEFLDRFRGLVSAAGEDPVGYSTHSMRRGGATELRRQDVPEELIAQHGGWKSRESMLKYFDGAVEFSRRAAALKAAERAQASSDEGVLCDVQFVEQFDL